MSGSTAIYTALYVYNAAGAPTNASDNYSDYASAYNADGLMTSDDNDGTPNVPHVVLAMGYDHLGRETSLSATIACIADFLNNYTHDSGRKSDSNYPARPDRRQACSRGETLVNFAHDADGEYTTISRYADPAQRSSSRPALTDITPDGQITESVV